MRRIAWFLGGVIMGGLVGAVLSLLFAPSSGLTLRQQIGERADTLTSEVRQAALDRRHELEQELERLRKQHVRLE